MASWLMHSSALLASHASHVTWMVSPGPTMSSGSTSKYVMRGGLGSAVAVGCGVTVGRVVPPPDVPPLLPLLEEAALRVAVAVGRRVAVAVSVAAGSSVAVGSGVAVTVGTLATSVPTAPSVPISAADVPSAESLTSIPASNVHPASSPAASAISAATVQRIRFIESRPPACLP